MARRHPGVVALWVAGGVSAVSLGASGLWLAGNYRPRRSGDQPMQRLFPDDTSGGWVGDVHGLSAVALVLVLLVGAGLALATLLPSGRLDPLMLGAVVLGATATAVAYRTGDYLPWSTLGLWSVRTGATYEGVWSIAWDEQIRFILNGGEATPIEYRLRMVTHLIAAPAILVAAVVMIAARARERPVRSR